MDQDRDERVRARAYEIWDNEGRKEGEQDSHWQQAENELREAVPAEAQEEHSASARSDSPDARASADASAKNAPSGGKSRAKPGPKTKKS